MTSENSITIRTRHQSIPPIYLSYSNECDFIERYFIVKIYEKLVKNGLGEGVIWFDHHQGIHPDKTASWFADRLEAIDLSLGSLLILSSRSQCQRLMLIESKAIVDRKILSKTSSIYGLFVILLDQCQNYSYLHSQADFFYTFNKIDSILNIDEHISFIIDDLLLKLLPYKKLSFYKQKLTINDEQFKPLCCWTLDDIQTFLIRLGVDQTSRDLFYEKQIDGYLLLSCTENELRDYFLINDDKIRRDLIENVIQTIHHERQNSIQWHYGAKKLKGNANYIYIIHHPKDSLIAIRISNFFKEKNFRVFTHSSRYGKTKQEFLSLNGPIIARTKYVIYLLTKKSSNSNFKFLELTIAEWFEKSIITVYVDNIWTNIRSSIRAILANYPLVDFNHQSFNESLTILYTYLCSKIVSTQISVVYNEKIEQTIQPLIVNSNLKSKVYTSVNENNSHFIYLSYSKINEKWNVTHAIQRLVYVLETNHYHTGIQIKKNNNNNNNTSREKNSHYLPLIQTKSSTSNSYLYGFTQSLASSSNFYREIGPGDIRHCCMMIVCLTPNYFHNEHCLNELRLCEIYQKPILVCLLRHLNTYNTNNISNGNMNLDEQVKMFIPSRFPMTTLQFLRKNIRSLCIDLSTDELFSRNIRILLKKLEKTTEKYQTSMEDSTNSLDSNLFGQTSEIF
ncbi:unnamed protein product [Adineta steineri]|uniref:SAM domain-containing protein n=1 Tax=Adineta steineri TaxID=433720 RepID=A0A813MQJ1_9BILA|nr:unnamed protein product [Adineta steineri]CAF3513654.1 unnamed protein product [Adineta steineri]